MSNKINQTALMTVIKKGGSVAHDEPPPTPKKGTIPFQVRMSADLVERIDKLCEKRSPIYYSRHAWVMDAIMNKLIREEDKE